MNEDGDLCRASEDVFIAAKLPPALAKATEDEATYAVCVDGVGVIEFSSAELIDEKWIRLLDVTQGSIREMMVPANYKLNMGLEVRIDRILWATDGPFDS